MVPRIGENTVVGHMQSVGHMQPMRHMQPVGVSLDHTVLDCQVSSCKEKIIFKQSTKENMKIISKSKESR